MSNDTFSSLFILQFGSNIGYAIAPLEKMFYKAGLELAGGKSEKVHFAYCNFDKGHPNTLPAAFTNLVEFDFQNADSAQIANLSSYIAQNQIKLVVAFDIQPVHPLFHHLRQSGVTTIVAYYGAAISSLMPLWKLLLKKLQIALSRSKVDGLIFESQAMADFAIYGRGVPTAMIDIVPLGVDTDLFKPLKTDYIYDILRIPKNKKVIVYAGHMERRKGVYVLVQAAIELLVKQKRDDVFFLFFGNKGDESKEYERMYEGMGIEHSICFGGYRTDLSKIYPGCFCGVIPSTGWDSFTYTSIEMASSGLPIIASNFQGLSEAILDKKTGLLFEVGNVNALVDCLLSLIGNPKLAAEYGRQGRKRCEEELNLTNQYNHFIGVLRKRLSQHCHNY